MWKKSLLIGLTMMLTFYVLTLGTHAATAKTEQLDGNQLLRLSYGHPSGVWTVDGKTIAFGDEIELPATLVFSQEGNSEEIYVEATGKHTVLIGEQSNSKPEADFVTTGSSGVSENYNDFVICYDDEVSVSITHRDSDKDIQWYADTMDYGEASKNQSLLKMPKAEDLDELLGFQVTVKDNTLCFSGISKITPGHLNVEVIYLRAMDVSDGSYWNIPLYFWPEQGVLSMNLKVNGSDFPEDYQYTYDGGAPKFQWVASVGENPVSFEGDAASDPTKVCQVTYQKINDAVQPGEDGYILAEYKESPKDAGDYLISFSVEGNEYYKTLNSVGEFYKIVPKTFTAEQITGEGMDTPVIFNELPAGQLLGKEIKVYDEALFQELEAGVDYELLYAKKSERSFQSSILTAGEHILKLRGKGNYQGELEEEFEVYVGKGKLLLETGTEYYLSGSNQDIWKLSEQPGLNYYGGTRFYVQASQNYTFQKQ